MAKTPFKMKGSPMKRNFGIGTSPMKLRDVWVENEEGVMVNMGTGPAARRYAHKIAQENVKLQEKQDAEGVDEEGEDYDWGKKIKFTDEDLDINEQAKEDLHKMETDAYGGRFFTPESTDEERRRAVSTISTGEGVPTESDKQRKARLRKARLKA